MASDGGGKGCGSGALSAAVGALGTPWIGGLFPNARTDTGQLLGSAATHGLIGGLASVAGGGLTALCAFVTGGTCATAAPYIVAGSVAIGRTAGGALGSWVEDQITGDDGTEDTILESRKFDLITRVSQ